MSGSLSNSPNDLLPTYSQGSGQRINRQARRRVTWRRAPPRAHVRESRG
jgi:hypothetical protein